MKLKDEALQAISSLPANANMDDIMYRLYVLDKIHKGQDAVNNGNTITSNDLKIEMSQW